MLDEPVPPTIHNPLMPLAHPVSATPTSNVGEAAIAVTFALARPGETSDDFQMRINSRGEWGQTSDLGNCHYLIVD